MEHHYRLDMTWQGNRGTGTSGYRDYGRDVLLRATGKPDLAGSADPTFRGDASRWNPEEMLLAALAQCHCLSYLHSAVNHGVVVTAYDDQPVATLDQVGQGGRFTSVVLRPRVTVAAADQVETAVAIHAEAAENCFIAASVNFPVTHEPVVTAC
ncbi:OsmC family protein [Nocardioides sp. AE5]|uniref:OsmC family protein n=1 Tax=Nocardioides sp. AE5 TaxID=2962573 RepID=UPI0028827A70|nr:OsmC family protein [Nocardioides sp. AE5]MDT0200890.1 OsmC family protein [Nocardioides sp. AE5]